MTRQELWTINRDEAFLADRHKPLRRYNIVLAGGGAAIIVLWFLLSSRFPGSDTRTLHVLRLTTIGFYALNLTIALLRAHRRAYKFHLTAGFYAGTLFSALLAAFTGGFESSCWFGLVFILLAWFILIPYSVGELMGHSLLFVVLNSAILWFIRPDTFSASALAQINFVFFTLLFIGYFSAQHRNMSDAENYLNRLRLQERNEELQTMNEELRAEMESHQETTEKLIEQQQLVSAILDNAPIIIWSIDLEGRFTFSQGKGLERLGLRPGERIGRSVIELYEGTQVAQFVQGVLDGKTTAEVVQLGDLYYDTRVSPLVNSSGFKYGYMGIAVDVSERMKIQNELEKFRLVLDQAPGSVFFINPKGYFEYANPYFLNASGYTNNELINNSFTTLFDNPQAPHAVEIAQALRRGETWQGEHLTNRKSGETYWVNTIAAPYRNRHQEVEGYIFIQQDISEHKKYDNALKESEEKYRMLVENATDGIVITSEGRFVFVNPKLCNMLQYTEEELIGRSFLDVVPQEDQQAMIQYHKRRMSGEVFQVIYNTSALRKDGQKVVLELNAATMTYQGKPSAFIIARDITERTLLQQAIETSEKKYRELADFLPQTVFELNGQGCLTFVNHAAHEFFGLPMSETFIGRRAIDFFDPRDHQLMAGNLRAAENRMSEYTALKYDGTPFPVLIYSAPIFHDGHLAGRRGIIVDISERKSMEEALRCSEEKHRMLIHSLKEGLVVIQDKRFTFLNEAIVEIVGYTVDELLGQEFTMVFPENLRQTLTELHQRRIRGENVPSDYESRLLHKDGTTLIPVILSVTPGTYDGKPAIIATARDISSRVRIENELRKTQEELQHINQALEQKVAQRTLELTAANTKLLKLQKENLQSQFDMLKNQVNPHFLFNSLNVLISLIRIEPELAERFTEQLAKVYRYVLENKDKDLVKLSTELDFLRAYVFLLDIRFLDKVKVSIEIAEHDNDKLVLPLALQLLIENAIKHNTFSKASPLVISIFIDQHNYLNVINNYQGRNTPFASTKVGLRNISSRYSLLTDLPPSFELAEKHFIARIPLLSENHKHETA